MIDALDASAPVTIRVSLARRKFKRKLGSLGVAHAPRDGLGGGVPSRESDEELGARSTEGLQKALTLGEKLITTLAQWALRVGTAWVTNTAHNRYRWTATRERSAIGSEEHVEPMTVSASTHSPRSVANRNGGRGRGVSSSTTSTSAKGQHEIHFD